jgi:predicted DCC family thiol-disulfide oxidoreductase YuxK
MSAQSVSKHVLAYDSDCGPCTKFMHLVDSLDRSDRIEFISITNAIREHLLDELPRDAAYRSFHLILPDGAVKSGSEGLLELIGILPGGRISNQIIRYMPGAKGLVRLIYTKLSTLHNNSSCAADENKK